MDFNDDLDFEPVNENNESIIDSKDSFSDQKEDIFKKAKTKAEKENIFDKTKNEEDIFAVANTKEESTKEENIFNNVKEKNSEEEKEIAPKEEKIEKTKHEENGFNVDIKSKEIKSDKKVINENKEETAELDFVSTNFSDEFNKLKLKDDILNMNNEILKAPKHYTFFQKYGVVFPIFAFCTTLFLGLYLFVSNVRASQTNLIKIEEKNKIGYIDDKGKKVVNAKYMSGTNFYKGYAVVKNENNLSGIINNHGDMKAYFGNYFYIERYFNNYIVSKFTSEGLKLGLLDSNLNEVTKFKYDNITYAKYRTFLFSRDNVVGILDESGKEIYTFAVDETDNKDIEIEVSNVPTKNRKKKYAKLKVNASSTIINLSTGKVVYNYTLDNINVHDNNVFSIESKSGNNTFFVIDDDKVKYKTDKYKLVRVDDYKSNILICLKNDMKYDYINLNTKKIMNENENIKYYYSDGLLLENKNDFEKNKNMYYIKNASRTLGEFSNINIVEPKIVNGFIKAYTKNMKLNYIASDGKFLSEEEYDNVSNFNKFGYAIVSKNELYGVIDKTGKEVVPIKYEKITTVNDDFFRKMKNKYGKEIFIFQSGNKQGIISVQDGIIINASYDSFEFITMNYPILIGNNSDEKNIINIENSKEFKVDIEKDIEVHDNYIYIDNKYYNYDGNIIYKINQEG